MNVSSSIHNFHIPVMGLAFTIDSPIRVAQYGISSVISIIDDELVEKLNAYYSEKFNHPYHEISRKAHDYRAKRFTSYLNLVDKIVKDKFEDFKKELTESKSALENFRDMLPNTSEIKDRITQFLEDGSHMGEKLQHYLDAYLKPGDIDVNIMTKIDKDNYIKGEQLPIEFNDAHASLRGFANSNLKSSVVLSAGMNPRLYSYFEKFKDFFPDSNNELKKKITLKVSDFRSAIIQGKFLAKKGLWVSEYRIESGLNCGGHAFATNGFLLGPILEEFKNKKNELIQETHEIYVKALEEKSIPIPKESLGMKVTVQGGVGTSEEHQFLIDQFDVDSVGWGTPFLLVPEATSVDNETRDLLTNAKEEDLFLSGISPLGVPFNTVKGSSNELIKQARIDQNKAGSSCPKKYLALSKEMGPEGVCTASKKYQDVQLKNLEMKRSEISKESYEKEKFKITEKACLCVGLSNSALMDNEIPLKGQAQGVVICPGPNLAYFDKQVSLLEMIQHIYGYKSVISHPNRPNMFMKELKMYIEYLRDEIENFNEEINARQIKKWESFKENLFDGIQYYQQLFSDALSKEQDIIRVQLQQFKVELENLEFSPVHA